jgi:hypothetical protein
MKRTALLIVLLLALASTGWAQIFSAGDAVRVNRMHPTATATQLGSAVYYLQERPIILPLNGTLGAIGGPGTDGVYCGSLTNEAVTKCFLSGKAQPIIAKAFDSPAYTTETTGANNATADDITLVPTAGTVSDKYYFGHATLPFESVAAQITTQGNVVGGTVTWEYWNGAWVSLGGVTDGFALTGNAFNAAPGWVRLTFTVPADWVVTTVDSVSAYWIRASVTAITSGGGAKAGRAYAIVPTASATFTDYTTAAGDAGANDCYPSTGAPAAGDAFYVGYTSKFAAIKATVGTAETGGTWTTIAEYSKAAAAWGTLTGTYDTTAIMQPAATGTKWFTFSPPTDWVQSTVNSQTKYWVRFRTTAYTAACTNLPVLTQLWVQDLTHGTGIAWPERGLIRSLQWTCGTQSATNADSKFLLCNLTTGLFAGFTMTKAVPVGTATGLNLVVNPGDFVCVKQIQHDGSTEFANASLLCRMNQ